MTKVDYSRARGILRKDGIGPEKTESCLRIGWNRARARTQERAESSKSAESARVAILAVMSPSDILATRAQAGLNHPREDRKRQKRRKRQLFRVAGGSRRRRKRPLLSLSGIKVDRQGARSRESQKVLKPLKPPLCHFCHSLRKAVLPSLSRPSVNPSLACIRVTFGTTF